jgi:signal transduction histidine kinase
MGSISAGTLGSVATASGRTYSLEASRPLSEVVDTFDGHDDAIGVLITDDGRFVNALSRESVARFLSRPYTQFLYLHRPISHLLASWTIPALECPDHADVSEVITLALSRPAEQRYEPIVASGPGSLRLVDVHGLLVQQNRILANTLSSLELQRTATARAEREREELQAQLIEASRNAGRAEVATGILHNVGNVLNSVSVARAVVSRKLEQSKVPNLAKAAQLLNDHREHIGRFMTEDPRGQQLPGYLVKLADTLAEERAFLLHEMTELGENVEHIKQVVATQQSYARARAVVQPVRPADLMDDAVRMNALSFERHNVTVERRYEDIDPVPMDRHKVLQVLVNLISNAKNAVKKAAQADRRIMLSVSRCAGGPDAMIQFVVEDNGVGIPGDNLRRIFSHGFTTRKDGHGFGLHSSANFAKELSGTLTVDSDGPGCGARFTLQLPAAPRPAVRGAA